MEVDGRDRVRPEEKRVARRPSATARVYRPGAVSPDDGVPPSAPREK